MRLTQLKPRLPKLHPLSWCVAGVMTVFVLLVQVAGQEQHDYKLLKPLQQGAGGFWRGGGMSEPSNGGSLVGVTDQADRSNNTTASQVAPPDFALEYEHGWPLPWGRRSLGYGQQPWRMPNEYEFHSDPPFAVYGKPISWSYRSAWSWSYDRRELYVGGVVLNVLLAVALVVVPTLLCEWWICRRRGRWQFRIVDMLGLMVIVAAGLGFWRWEKQAVDEERHILEMLASFDDGSRVYIGPDWLRRLVGNEQLVPVMRRVRAVEADRLQESHELDRALQGLHSLEEIRIEITPTQKQIELLARLPRLRQLTLAYGTGLNAVPSDEPTPDYHLLSKSRSIEEVSITCSYLIADDLEHLLQMPQLQFLSTESACLTAEQIDQLSLKYSSVDMSDTSDERFSKSIEEIALVNGLLERWRRKYRVDRSYVSRVIQLDLTKYSLNDAMLLELIPVLGNRTRLLLNEATISPRALGEFSSKTKVTKLKIFGNWLTDQHLEQLARNKSWDYVTLNQGKASIESMEELLESTSITILDIISEKIPKSEVERLRKKYNEIKIYHNGSRIDHHPN